MVQTGKAYEIFSADGTRLLRATNTKSSRCHKFFGWDWGGYALTFEAPYPSPPSAAETQEDQEEDEGQQEQLVQHEQHEQHEEQQERKEREVPSASPSAAAETQADQEEDEGQQEQQVKQVQQEPHGQYEEQQEPDEREGPSASPSSAAETQADQEEDEGQQEQQVQQEPHGQHEEQQEPGEREGPSASPSSSEETQEERKDHKEQEERSSSFSFSGSPGAYRLHSDMHGGNTLFFLGKCYPAEWVVWDVGGKTDGAWERLELRWQEGGKKFTISGHGGQHVRWKDSDGFFRGTRSGSKATNFVLREKTSSVTGNASTNGNSSSSSS
ncbi:unnamed protein product [Ectocarpus fasciculatus]